MIAKLTSSDLEDSITQLESQIETLEDTIEGSDSSDDDYASNVRKYKDLTMKLSTLKTERSNLTVTSKYNGIVAVTLMDGKRSAALLNWIVTGYVATPSLVDPTFDT